MWKIEHREYGVHLTFSGHIKEAEMEAWLEASKKELAKLEPPFGVFVDMRDMILLPPESQPAMQAGQRYYREQGMVRSVVILQDDVLAMQFQRIAKKTGIYEWERYIDASNEPNWEQAGLDWIIDAIDPDQNGRAQFENFDTKVENESGKVPKPQVR
jgi:hypothetical protein